MKNKYLLLIMSTTILVSCASKPTSPVAKTETPKAEIVEVVKPVQTDRGQPIAKAIAEQMSPMPENIGVSAGKSLYQNNCGSCHKLFAAKEFSKEDWLPILKSMQKKADLNDENMAAIKAYIFSEL